jgi:hypothetical protein
MTRESLQQRAMLDYCKTIIVEYIRSYDLSTPKDTYNYVTRFGFNAEEYNEAIDMLLISTIKVDLSCVPANLELVR